MEERDSLALVQRFQQVLDHVCESGGLRPSDLQLPIYASPQYYKQLLPGYEGGAFDPERLGTACIVVPPSTDHGASTPCTWNPCTWSLSQVPTPHPLSDHPSSLQHLCLVEQALVRA